MTDKECLDWLESTRSGLYYHMSGFGPVWEITSVPDRLRFTYRTCREAVIETAKRFPTRESLDKAQQEIDKEEEPDHAQG